MRRLPPQRRHWISRVSRWSGRWSWNSELLMRGYASLNIYTTHALFTYLKPRIVKNNPWGVEFHSCTSMRTISCDNLSFLSSLENQKITCHSWKAITSITLNFYRNPLAIPYPPPLRWAYRNPTVPSSSPLFLGLGGEWREDTVALPAALTADERREGASSNEERSWRETVDIDGWLPYPQVYQRTFILQSTIPSLRYRVQFMPSSYSTPNQPFPPTYRILMPSSHQHMQYFRCFLPMSSLKVARYSTDHLGNGRDFILRTSESWVSKATEDSERTVKLIIASPYAVSINSFSCYCNPTVSPSTCPLTLTASIVSFSFTSTCSIITHSIWRANEWVEGTPRSSIWKGWKQWLLSRTKKKLILVPKHWLFFIICFYEDSGFDTVVCADCAAITDILIARIVPLLYSYDSISTILLPYLRQHGDNRGDGRRCALAHVLQHASDHYFINYN